MTAGSGCGGQQCDQESGNATIDLSRELTLTWNTGIIALRVAGVARARCVGRSGRL